MLLSILMLTCRSHISAACHVAQALGEMNEDMAAALFESKDSCTVTSLISSVTKRDTLDAHMPLPVSESDKGALVKVRTSQGRLSLATSGTLTAHVVGYGCYAAT